MVENKYYMTGEDFEGFLKEIGGLENGYFTDRPKIMERYFFDVGNGWLGLIKELIEESIKLGWDRQICQIKEKFGGLRFYINDASDGVHKLISEAEDKSYEICEVCGEPGGVRKINGWLVTLCDKHNKERGKR
jgi:hypothetical protein